MELREAVTLRLSMLGYQAGEEDTAALDYLEAKCKADLLADLHQKELPEGLRYALADMVAGSLLRDRLAAGVLEIEGLDFGAAPKSITEGDVRVDFAGASDGASSAQAQFVARLDDLIHPPERVVGAYRRLAW